MHNTFITYQKKKIKAAHMWMRIKDVPQRNVQTVQQTATKNLFYSVIIIYGHMGLNILPPVFCLHRRITSSISPDSSSTSHTTQSRFKKRSAFFLY